MSDQKPDSSQVVSSQPASSELRRSLSLPLITFYGVGTIIGGGIYALLGEVAGQAGMATPLAFLIASCVAGLSAFSFAELSARYPVSAGEAHYVRAAFGTRWLGPLVGMLVILTGSVSAATLCRAVASFLVELVGTPENLNIVLVVLVLTLVAAWGIIQSVVAAAVITLIELGGLIAVIALRSDVLAQLPERWNEIMLPGVENWAGLGFGAFLALYAYVGFEDMVNVAEEVRDPQRNLPIAIIVSLIVTSTLYALVCLVAVLAVPPDELARSRVPLASLVSDGRPGARVVLNAVSVLAGVNGALIQIVMATRIVYGLKRHSSALTWLSKVNARTQTPVRATVAIAVFVLALAFWLPLVTLAAITSAIILVVFGLVNLSLLRIRLRDGDPPPGCPRYPLWIPGAGLVLCCTFLAMRCWMFIAE